MDGRQWARLASIGLVGVAAPLAAQARPATVFWDSYLRAGPGRQFAVLDELAPRSSVDLRDCQGDWCHVVSAGAEGYIEAAMLAAPDIHAKPPAPPPTAACVQVRVNGTATSSGEALRVCQP